MTAIEAKQIVKTAIDGIFNELFEHKLKPAILEQAKLGNNKLIYDGLLPWYILAELRKLQYEAYHNATRTTTISW